MKKFHTQKNQAIYDGYFLERIKKNLILLYCVTCEKKKRRIIRLVIIYCTEIQNILHSLETCTPSTQEIIK